MTAANSKEKGKPRGKSFKPGQSGNPTGRPKLPEDIKHVRELAREYTAQAVTTLVDVMNEGSGPAKVAAAQAILDRGWGKPSQPVDGDGEGGAIKHTVRVIFE
jgi:hypothetical protein